MLVHFHLKILYLPFCDATKYFRYHATDLEVLILMSKGGNQNVYVNTRIFFHS